MTHAQMVHITHENVAKFRGIAVDVKGGPVTAWSYMPKGTLVDLFKTMQNVAWDWLH